jgi:hypothetical protein
MKNIGYLLITVGFLFGSYFSVVDTVEVAWSFVIPGLILGLLGVAMAQIASRGSRRGVEAVHTSMNELEESLARIVDNARKLDEEKETIDVYDVRHQIDDLFMSDLDIFVENRESIGHAFGLQSYADVMTQFATGERYLNRCWSASTDGYIDEVRTYLTRTQEHFAEALKKLKTLRNQS